MTTSAVRAINQPECPKCGKGNMYDNRAENDQRAARGEKLRPDWKCRNRACDGCIWRPKKQDAPQQQAAESSPSAPTSLADLLQLYDACFAHAVKLGKGMVEKHPEIGASPESVASMAATLFIAARNGR